MFLSAHSLPAADLHAYESDPFYRTLKPAFGRGINMANALVAPKEGDWGVTIKAEYFSKMKAAGFDSVRIPVRWSGHAETTAPYTIYKTFLDRVDFVVQLAIRNRLTPIVNMHNYDELVHHPEENRARFVALWKQISEHFKSAPPEVAFELFNEPNGELSAEKWNAIADQALTEVRKSNPTRRVVIGPVGWNAITELKGLSLPAADHNLVVTVHYYNPFHFTHQGADWVGNESKSWLGTKWMGTAAEKAEVDRDFDTAISWAVKHHVPILLGEFGAYSKGDMASRVRWTKYVADAAVKRKMGFAYWEFCSSFGAYDPQTNDWIVPLKEALLGRSKKTAFGR
jgi:endoglucanase